MTSGSSGYRARQFGKYTLLERIGAGGMAEIWRAKMYGQHGFEKEVAIKMILPNLTDDAEFVEMFINEAKIMVGLVHSNVVQVFDLGELDEQYFITMEYVHGKDLLDLLARCAELQLKIPLKLGVFVVTEMLKGLHYAHSALDYYGSPLGIIHRDVSPSNVLLSYTGEVKVGDFGVAKAATQRAHTEVGTLKGKVGYMSPEHVRGDHIVHRSDLFAAGIILFEILNMRRLFIGGSDLDVMLSVRDVNIEDDLDSAVPLPPDLRAIVIKALARTSQERYQSAKELHDDLMEFLYVNRIRVSGTDLARFLGRVFEKDIEQDKLKRLKFRDQEANVREMALRAVATADPRAPAPVQRPVDPPPNPGSVSQGPPAPAPRPKTPPHQTELRYRYRDSSGLVFGPMSAHTLTNLLAGSPLDPGDRISVDEGRWVGLDQMQAIHAAVIAAKEKSGLHIQAKSSAAVKAPPEEPPESDTLLPAEGDLIQSSFANLMFKLWSEKASGSLTIRHGNTYKRVFFDGGNPANVVSNNDSELLGNFLVREGILSETQLSKALERARVFGGRLGDALVADRVIQSHVLYEYLFRQAKLKLFDVFTWRRGTFEYDPLATPGARTYPLGIESLEIILDGVKRYIYSDTLRDYFKGLEHTPMSPAKDRKLELSDLRLTARQLRIAQSTLVSSITLDTLDRTLTGGNITLEDIQRVIYLMLQLELIIPGR